jgi:hypothetical protein
VRLRLSKHSLGTVLSVAAAVVVTAQAMNAPPKPYKARDIVPASPESSAAFAGVCAMYPAECHFNADGSVARVIGRRIVPGSHTEILNHFRAAIGVVPAQWWDVKSWEVQQ